MEGVPGLGFVLTHPERSDAKPDGLGVLDRVVYTTNMAKEAAPDYPVHELVAERWSPYAFSPRLIPRGDLHSIFEAARWAASSFNEQPWRYVIANRDSPGDFERLLACLLEGNRTWAREAATLALGCAKTTFSRNGKPNRVAQHDLGLASANLTFEATSRGVSVHQMAGILPDAARAAFSIPADFEVVTALALGYRADPGVGAPELLARDGAARKRRSQAEFVFGAEWGRPGLGPDA